MTDDVANDPTSHHHQQRSHHHHISKTTSHCAKLYHRLQLDTVATAVQMGPHLYKAVQLWYSTVQTLTQCHTLYRLLPNVTHCMNYT